VGPGVVFTNDLRPRASLWDEDRLVRTTVKRGASVGTNATIICGVVIGAYAMVGAGSVVTREVPAFSLVYGNPALRHGYVCYCGETLGAPFAENDKEASYACPCGKTVVVQKAA